MKASLQLKMGQQLAMTPQLQQAIRLLQLSTLDLQQEIQEALDSNPLLEVEEILEKIEISDNHERHSDTSDKPQNAEQENKTDDQTRLDEQWSTEQMPEDMPTDSQWEDTYQISANQATGSQSYTEDFDFLSTQSSEDSLQDHLHWQLNLTPFSDIDREIAEMLIDGVDDDGYLHTSTEDVIDSFSHYEDIEQEEVLAVLHRLQQFDPAGVFAKDLQECLLLQLKQLNEDTPWKAEAELIITQHIQLLGTRDYASLMRKTQLKETQLKSSLALIQSLNPKPGAIITPEHCEYIVPDVIVRQVKDDWLVELNPDIAPKLRVNDEYAALIKRADNSEENTFLKDNLQEARWFIKSLHSRNDTLLKVAREIVAYQIDFFEQGEEAMKPLVLHDIATAVDMHESTISRVTTQKYMHTPKGLFELKYFFSSHVGTDSGGECSSTAIRAMIKKLIAGENPSKPLSDNKIANQLAEKGIKVARRTVAKYREALLIPPSNERKELV